MTAAKAARVLEAFALSWDEEDDDAVANGAMVGAYAATMPHAYTLDSATPGRPPADNLAGGGGLFAPGMPITPGAGGMQSAMVPFGSAISIMSAIPRTNLHAALMDLG